MVLFSFEDGTMWKMEDVEVLTAITRIISTKITPVYSAIKSKDITSIELRTRLCSLVGKVVAFREFQEAILDWVKFQ